MATPSELVFTCEHGGREVPDAYRHWFKDHEALLETHRGWDPGALELGMQFAEVFEAPLFASTTTRLLVDLNRSIGHPELHSEATRALPLAARREIVALHYRPHRDAVETEVAKRIADGERVLHIACHSFTPELHGVVRRADVAWLYDPKRKREAAFSQAWLAALRRRTPGSLLRRNYPYQGRDDGLTTLLRRRHPAEAYVGIELEVNQRFVAAGGDPWATLREDLVATLREALAFEPA